MKKAAFLFFRVEVGNAACAVQYLVVVQTMLVRCPKNLDFTVFQKVSLSNLIFRAAFAQSAPAALANNAFDIGQKLGGILAFLRLHRCKMAVHYSHGALAFFSACKP